MLKLNAGMVHPRLRIGNRPMDSRQEDQGDGRTEDGRRQGASLRRKSKTQREERRESTESVCEDMWPDSKQHSNIGDWSGHATMFESPCKANDDPIEPK